jgi:hypothetical protein
LGDAGLRAAVGYETGEAIERLAELTADQRRFLGILNQRCRGLGFVSDDLSLRKYLLA